MTPTDARPSGQSAADSAPVYRLLSPGETIENGDEFWGGTSWLLSGHNGGAVETIPYRRLFSPVVPRVVVVLEGSRIADVLADGRVDVLRIDYDTDGAEAIDLVPIPQTEPANGYSDALAFCWHKQGTDGERVGELFGAVARHTVGDPRPARMSARAAVLFLENFTAKDLDAAFDAIKEEARPTFAVIATEAEIMASDLDAEDERPENLALHAHRMAISNWATAREGLE